MEDLFKSLNPTQILVWVAPGAFIAMFRSFALKGSFPSLGKDDLAALILGSVCYRFLALAAVGHLRIEGLSDGSWGSTTFWILVIFVVPSLAGFLLGLFEASDWIGNFLRTQLGVQMPSPTPTAWDTLFKLLPPNTVLIVQLKDGAKLYGRWTNVGVRSCASSDNSRADLYIGEIGTLNANQQYVPVSPQRGLYIASDLIRTIEVVN